jgi:hypothetical protein
MKQLAARTSKPISTFLLAVFVAATISVAPAQKAEAVVYFGGAIGPLIYCINSVTYVKLGAPRGGPYLWSPKVTKTYEFGPPSHSGQWLLGAAGPTYFCIVSVLPLVVLPGLLMLYMGSSQ